MQVNVLLSPTRRCTNDVPLQDLTNQLRGIIHENVTIRHENHSYLRLDWLEMMLSDRYPQTIFHLACALHLQSSKATLENKHISYRSAVVRGSRKCWESEHCLLGNYGCLRREPGARQMSLLAKVSQQSKRKPRTRRKRNDNSHNSSKVTIEDAIIL